MSTRGTKRVRFVKQVGRDGPVSRRLITALAQRYTAHPAVDSVFGVVEGRLLRVFVFLTGCDYDPNVMSTFSGFEYELRRSFPQASLDIEYVPERAADGSGVLPIGSFQIQSTTV
jgi:hypothetical protein